MIDDDLGIHVEKFFLEWSDVEDRYMSSVAADELGAFCVTYLIHVHN